MVLLINPHWVTVARNTFFPRVSPEPFLTLVTLPATKPLPISMEIISKQAGAELCQAQPQAVLTGFPLASG